MSYQFSWLGRRSSVVASLHMSTPTVSIIAVRVVALGLAARCRGVVHICGHRRATRTGAPRLTSSRSDALSALAAISRWSVLPNNAQTSLTAMSS